MYIILYVQNTGKTHVKNPTLLEKLLTNVQAKHESLLQFDSDNFSCCIEAFPAALLAYQLLQCNKFLANTTFALYRNREFA